MNNSHHSVGSHPRLRSIAPKKETLRGFRTKTQIRHEFLRPPERKATFQTQTTRFYFFDTFADFFGTASTYFINPIIISFHV